MKVCLILDDYKNMEVFDFGVSDIRSVLNGIRLHKGEELYERLLSEPFKYILVDSLHPENSIALRPEVVLTDTSSFDSLYIVQDISGEFPLAPLFFMAIAMATEGALGYALTWGLAYALTALVNIALGMVMNFVMQALAPTATMGKDPSDTQQGTKKSSLWNGPTIVTNQGCSVPLIFGNPWCGGVLITSYIYVG